MNEKDILTQHSPEEPVPDYLDPEAVPKVLTIENMAHIMEHKLVQTLIDIMEQGSDRDRLNAVDKTAEVLGKKQNKLTVVAQNAQIQQNNNQFLDHLKKQAHQLPSPISDKGGPDEHDRDLPASFGNTGVVAHETDPSDRFDEEVES